MKKVKKKKNKKSFKEKFLKLKENFKYKYNEFRENPIECFKILFPKIKESIKKNKYFLLFILINLLNEMILRLTCFGKINYLFKFPPIYADLFVLIVFGSFGYLMNNKKQIIYYITLSFIFTTLCTVNSAYYTFYTSFASVSFLSTTKFLVSVGDAVVENVLKLKDFIYPLLFAVLIISFIRFNKNNITKNNKNVKAFINSLKVSIVFLILFSINLTGTDIGNLVQQWNRCSIVNKYGVYVYHINDFIKSMEPKLTSLFGYDKALKNFNEYFEDNKNKNETNKYTGILEGKNVIGIHCESMMNYMIGLKINNQEVTPNLNKLASKSLYFTNFYSQVSVGTSSDTEFTLATSLMPSNTGTAFGSFFDRTYVSLPQLLKDKGYYTFSMHGNTADYWNRRVMHERLGYDHFYAKAEYEIDETIGLGLSDSSFFRQSIEKLKTIKTEHDKFYGTLIMLTNHTPFSETEKYGEFDVSMTVDGVNYPYMEGTKLGNYIKSVHYADKCLGEFFEALEKEGLMDNTVIVLYGDHDSRLDIEDYQRFYNYDYLNDDILSEDDSNYKEFNDYNYELNRAVPLIIYSKNIEPKKINSVMGMYDLMPTLGNMLNVKNEYALGHDIFNHLNDNVVVFPTGNWLTNEVYYNNQKNEYYALKQTVISDEYIKKYCDYSQKLLAVSDSIIVYDLIKKIDENKVNEAEVIGD